MLIAAALLALLAPPRGLEWFPGTFEQALEKARAEKKLVFVDFWASWCGVCKQFEAGPLSDPAVASEARDLVCLRLDVESPSGAPVAARYGAAGQLPSLVFVEPDGSLRDRLNGFRTAAQFVQEIRRIRANEGTLGELLKRVAAAPDDPLARLDLAARLKRANDRQWTAELAAVRDRLERGVGFDPRSPEQRFAIARKLRVCGDEKGYEAQLAAIRELDPEGRSEPMRRLALAGLIEEVHLRFRKEKVFDPEPVRSFLADEKSPTVLFEGWSMLHGMETFQERRAEALACARIAWRNCPEDRRAAFGREVAEAHLGAAELDPAALAFLVEVAEGAARAAPRSADHLRILGKCLERAGRKEDAAEAFRRASEIDPPR